MKNEYILFLWCLCLQDVCFKVLKDLPLTDLDKRFIDVCNEYDFLIKEALNEKH